jgi:fructokinase
MTDKRKILVAGTSVVDLIFKGQVFQKRQKKDRLSLALGGKYVPEEFYQRFGGGGANASVALAKLGFDVALWSRVGNDNFGKQIKKNLRHNKVNTNLLKFKAEHTPLSTILLTPTGKRTIITYRSDADQLELTNNVRKEMTKRPWLALFSLANLSKSKKIEYLHVAKKAGMRIFLSLHGTEYLQGFDYLKDYFKICDVLQINAHELADIFGGNAEDFNFKKTNFANKINVPLVVVTYDVNGSFAYTKDKIYHYPIIKVKNKIDTTGAGDCFGATFLGEYIFKDDLQTALAFATKNASSVITKLGAQQGLIERS